MNNPRGFSFPAFYITVIALLAIIALFISPILTLAVFIPVMIYLIWNLRNRVKDLEKRLGEKQATNA